MDTATPIIYKINMPEFKKIIVESSDGKKYFTELSSFESVYCFPKNFDEWKKAYPDSDGTAVIWSCRFEVHIDQIIGLAYQIENSKTSA